MAQMSRQFGPFRLVRRLGVGGMAETFEAARLGPGGFEHRVCLKRVLPAFSESKEFVQQFQREARLAAELTHSNIVGVLDFGEHDDTHYMALELVDGVDLRAFLSSQEHERLTPELVALIGMDLAYALDHAHSLGSRRGTGDRGSTLEGVVHRDLSPANVLISRAGEVKLADFGIAKAINNAAATASATVKGKIPYMAPEHILGQPVDGRADLFSLGVVLFEAASGHRPFDGAHDVETMRRILDGERIQLRDVAPHVPQPLADVIERLLALNPDERTQSAAALLEELAEAAAPSPQVRRELATIVEGQRGGVETREHVRPEDPEPDTAMTALPQNKPAEVSAWSEGNSRLLPRKKSTWMWIAIPAIVFAGLIGTRFWPSADPGAETGTAADAAAVTDTETAAAAAKKAAKKTAAATEAATGTETSTETPSAREATADTAATSTADPQPAADATPAEPVAAPPVPAKRKRPAAKPKRGALRVFVIPRGRVWIDRKYMGEVSRRPYPVDAGEHLVQAGYERPERSRKIKVRPGKTVRVEFDLDQ